MSAPKKRFGQHFLHDATVLDKIVHAVNAQLLMVKNQNASEFKSKVESVTSLWAASVIEIGPGRGALTRALLVNLPENVRLTCLEIDRDLIVYLQRTFAKEIASGRLNLIQTDVLTHDFSQLSMGTVVVGNLPYNISSPILFHLLPHADKIAAQIFMLQKEVVDRMVATPDDAHNHRTSARVYGRLSVMLQWCYHMYLLCDVAPEAFTPPPKVWSSVVSMSPHGQKKICTFDDLEMVVARAFNQRRKQLRNSLSNLFTEEQLVACQVSPNDRAENLSLTQYLALTQCYASQSAQAHARASIKT